jgi:hypothetical protein
MNDIHTYPTELEELWGAPRMFYFAQETGVGRAAVSVFVQQLMSDLFEEMHLTIVGISIS